MQKFRQRGAMIALACLVAWAAPATAQDQDIDRKLAEIEQRHRAELDQLRADYEARIIGLESQVQTLRGDMDDMAFAPGSELEQGLDALANSGTPAATPGGALGLTTWFQNVRNPGIGIVGDFIYAGSTLDDDFDLYEQFILRSVEVTIQGEADPLLEYYLRLHIDEEDFELEEAFALVNDLLPDTFMLKFGRFNVDHGKLSPQHEHALPFVDKPGVLQEFLGGSLRGTGVELHHWMPLAEDHLFRWSVGVINSPDSDVHAIGGPLAGEHHHHEDEEALPGERDLENFAFNARATALFQIDWQDSVQVGASVLWAPDQRTRLEHEEEEHDHEDDEEEEEVFVRDLEHLVVSLDITYRSIDPSDGSGIVLQTELFYDNREIGDPETGLLDEVDSFGFHVWGEYNVDRFLSFGLAADVYEQIEGDRTAWDVGAFVTYEWSEFNRLRFEARWYENGLDDEDYLLLMVQWTTVIGTHGHPLPW